MLKERNMQTLRAAAKVAGVSNPTILRWCRKYPNLATLQDGKWLIDQAQLYRIIEARKVVKP